MGRSSANSPRAMHSAKFYEVKIVCIIFVYILFMYIVTIELYLLADVILFSISMKNKVICICILYLTFAYIASTLRYMYINTDKSLLILLQMPMEGK